ncbi:antibiotic biosynthesis monooxygenase [Pelagibius sp. 7325]|uniref:putative quinol monooxygenase n=1 Tax=Pelagibius sp. 7325 TaxID=3131994 RepID=UPI0030EFA2C4
MFVVTVVFKVKKDVVEAFRKAVQQQAKNSLTKEEGCERFDVCFDSDDPQGVFLYELYVDAAAFEAHTQTDHFKNFREVSQPMLEDREVRFWSLQKAA